MEVIEAIGGVVNSMLDFPLVEFLGRLLPAGGSEARQQVATAFGAGLHNLGSLCSQAGLDRWELLGLAVLSAITVYRKELSSNSVYNGKGVGNCGGRDGGRHAGRRYHRTDCGDSAAVVHVDGCHMALDAAAAAVGAEVVSDSRAGAGAGKPCMCASISALQRQRASVARRLRAAEDERKLKRFVARRIRSMNLPVNHLQQLRASVDASWHSFSTAWEARRAKGSGGTGDVSAEEGAKRERAKTAPLSLLRFELPPCSHRASSSQVSSTHLSPPPKDCGLQQQLQPAGSTAAGGGTVVETPRSKACMECAAIAAAHQAAASLLHGNPDGGGGADGLLLPGGEEGYDLWAESSLRVLPEDTLHRVAAYLPPQDLLELAQVSNGAREVADSQLVWREAWWARFGVIWESDICKKAAARWHLHNWDPKSSDVTQGWKEFFFEFESSWLGWIAAGQNTKSSCLVGVHGRLFDITEFMHRHPGSPETLMDNAGTDASEMFEDIGHSLDARRLMKSIPSLAPGSQPISRLSSPTYTRTVGGGGGGGGSCMLSSTAQRLREGWALAKREARAVHCQAVAARAVGATAVEEAAEVAHDFVCEECGSAFEPAGQDENEDTRRERQFQCSHMTGDLRVFYSPVRAEWGGFYSCCQKHVCFNLLPEQMGFE